MQYGVKWGRRKGVHKVVTPAGKLYLAQVWSPKGPKILHKSFRRATDAENYRWRVMERWARLKRVAASLKARSTEPA